MGHWCRICNRVLPNEKFSGKGHKNHICNKCTKLPKEKLEEIDQKNEIFEYLKQSNISKKNMVQLKKLSTSPNEKIAELARVVLEVARVSDEEIFTMIDDSYDLVVKGLRKADKEKLEKLSDD